MAHAPLDSADPDGAENVAEQGEAQHEAVRDNPTETGIRAVVETLIQARSPDASATPDPAGLARVSSEPQARRGAARVDDTDDTDRSRVRPTARGVSQVALGADLDDGQLPLRTIADSLPVLVSYIDRDQRYRFANLAYESWFGIPREQIIGKHMLEVLGAEACAALADSVDRALAGTSVSTQLWVPYRSGGERFIDATYVPHVGADGAVQGFAALISDISESKRAELAHAAEARRTERLMNVTAGIAEAVEPEQVLHAVVDRMVAALGATSVGLWLVSPDGARLALVRSAGYDAGLEHDLASAPLDPAQGFFAVEVVRRRAPLWLSAHDVLVRPDPRLAALARTGGGSSIACLPILAQGIARGCIAFSFADERILEPREQDLLLLVARYAGQALERLRLLEAERALRAQSEAGAARLALLGRASSAFASASPQLDALFSALAEQVTGSYADACCIVVRAGPERERLELAAVSHIDAEAAASYRETLATQPFELGRGLLGTVAQTGEPLLLPEVDHATLTRAASASTAQWLERHPPASVVVVPLKPSGKHAVSRPLGAFAALRHDPQRPFSLEDQCMLAELADRASVAIAAGQLYEANEQARVRAELLYELAARVIRAKTVGEVFDAALDGIERALGANRCSILAYDAAGVMRFKAWRGLSEQYRAAVEGHSPWPRSAQNPEPLVVADVLADAALLKYADLFQSEKIGALGFIPLVSEGRLVGKFMVYYPLPRRLSAPELDMARAIANHVAAAMGRFSSLRELEQTVRFNEIFTGMLGHDLRNPLGAIMTAAQIAERRSSDPQLAKPIARILNSGGRMAKMIDHLLDFTRVRVGAGIPIDPQPADAVQIVRQAMDEVSDAHPGSRLELEQAGAFHVVWDSDRILQVFSNLAANALHHGTPEHGVHVRIDATGADGVSVSFHNMGVVPSELLPRLFEPMAGGDRRRDSSRGIGLGLYISREIVKAHAGSIAVETSVVLGTTFTVHLPRVVRPG
jgi:PAS domain S-box-containing protein